MFSSILKGQSTRQALPKSSALARTRIKRRRRTHCAEHWEWARTRLYQHAEDARPRPANTTAAKCGLRFSLGCRTALLPLCQLLMHVPLRTAKSFIFYLSTLHTWAGRGVSRQQSFAAGVQDA